MNDYRWLVLEAKYQKMSPKKWLQKGIPKFVMKTSYHIPAIYTGKPAISKVPHTFWPRSFLLLGYNDRPPRKPYLPFVAIYSRLTLSLLQIWTTGLLLIQKHWKGLYMMFFMQIFFCNFNPIKPGGESFLPVANLKLNYFWTTSGMKLYDFS